MDRSDNLSHEAPKWQALARRACGDAGIPCELIETVHTWSQEHRANAVFRVDGTHYLKIYGPTAQNQFHVERAMLQAVLGERRIPAPQLVAIGEISAGMPYLVVKAVEGETAEDVWKHIPRDNQLSLASDLGTIVRAINEIPPQTLQAVEHRWGDRRAYAAAWREHMVRKIKMTITLPEHERNEFVRFLELEGRTLVEEGTTVTHRELAHNHVYLGLRDGRWSVTGVIDWADGMIGPAEWDTSFVWLWVFSRDRGAMEAFLETRYGPAGPPPLLGRRCLGVVLQTYEGPDLWEEIAGQLTCADEDPVHESAVMLFTEGIFG